MTANRLSINEWAEDDRSRERLERLGAESLSNAELLAILIGTGNAEQDAVQLMQRILSDCHNNLNSLGKMTLAELQAYKGIGPARPSPSSPLANWASGGQGRKPRSGEI